ncbi:hypothetical protein Tco_0741910 [Tanacetum coccineum]
MDKEASPPTVTIKAKIDVVKEIREALTPTQVEIFEKTCFGNWLDVGLKKNSQLLIHTLLTCMVDGKANELSFLVLDCGVMTCKFLEMLTKGKNIDIKSFGDNVGLKCQEYRAKMALMLYETRCERAV